MRVLSALAFVGVMLIHSAAPLYVSDCARWNYAFARFACKHLVSFAVPFFFFGSGYWFGRGRFMRGQSSYVGLLKNKALALLVPYIAWSIIGAVVGVPLIVITNRLQGNALFARTFLEGNGVFEKLDLLFGIKAFLPMHCGVLWFVKFLLIIFLFCFVWRIFVRGRLMAIVLLVLSVAAIILPSVQMPIVGLSSGYVGYFSLGVAFALMELMQKQLPRSLSILAFVGWVGLSLAMAICDGLGWNYHAVLTSLVPFMGVLAVLGLYDNCSFLNRIKLRATMFETFWLYCSHQMIAAWITAIVFHLLGKSDVVTFAMIFFTPVLVIPISLAVSNCVKKLNKRFYAILTGGRGK